MRVVRCVEADSVEEGLAKILSGEGGPLDQVYIITKNFPNENVSDVLCRGEGFFLTFESVQARVKELNELALEEFLNQYKGFEESVSQYEKDRAQSYSWVGFSAHKG